MLEELNVFDELNKLLLVKLIEGENIFEDENASEGLKELLSLKHLDGLNSFVGSIIVSHSSGFVLEILN